MLIEKTQKPSPWTSPIAWARRQAHMKFGDALRMAGLSTIERVDFRHMTGVDFAHVIDIGVADGSPDLYARFPNAVLELFEPHPNFHDHLRTGVLATRKGRLHAFAAGSDEGSAELFMKGRTGSSLVRDAGRGTVTVPVRRVDQCLNTAEILRPSLLKIDTEGFEMFVLKGATGILDAIDCVVVEVHFQRPDLYQPYEVLAFLAERGFGLTEMLDFYVGGHRFICADLVFRRISVSPAIQGSAVVAAAT